MPSNESPAPDLRLKTLMTGLVFGESPRWGRDGLEIFYLSSDRKMMAVPVKPGESFNAESPTPLFDVPNDTIDFDVSPDGQRFIINSRDDLPETLLVVISGWAANLKN